MKTIVLNEQQVSVLVGILEAQDYSKTYDKIVSLILEKLNDIK